jgi:aspartyl/glutamyl-tRNA(Asn/Gln) amidotransferase C subunit
MASAEDVKKLATLARLSIPDDVLAERAVEFDRIVSYIDQLSELSIDMDAAPTAPAHRNIFRKDGEPATPGTWTETLVGMFPKRDGDSLSVKKILSQD